MPKEIRVIRFQCPYLKTEVELTQERANHIATQHPDFFQLTPTEFQKHFSSQI